MADTAAETPNQRAARLRREKREKKITDGGSDRLARITNVSGRQQDFQPVPPPKPTVADDPGDVDIPHMPAAFTAPSNASTLATSNDDDGDATMAQFRAALRDQMQQGGNSVEDAGDASNNDPMQQLMQQMQQMLGAMGNGGGGGGGGGGGAGADGKTPGGGQGGAAAGGLGGPGGDFELPPALASLLGGKPMSAGQTPPPAAAATGAYIWRIVHALFAVSLGLYIVLRLPFTGSQTDRFPPGDSMQPPLLLQQHVFWIFTTAELGLQSTRYLLERGQPQQGGMIVTVAGFLPEPYKSYLLLVSRYFSIWTTLVEDVMVVVFMLGVVAWWKGNSE